MQTRRKPAIDRSTTSYATTMPEKRRRSRTRRMSGSLRLLSDERADELSGAGKTHRTERSDVSYGGHFTIKECRRNATIFRFGRRSFSVQPDTRICRTATPSKSDSASDVAPPPSAPFLLLSKRNDAFFIVEHDTAAPCAFVCVQAHGACEEGNGTVAC